MKLKSVVGGALMMVASFGAYAGNQTVTLNPAKVVSFAASDIILDGGDDVITFNGLTTGQQYRISITVSSQNVDWDQVHTTLNGVTGDYYGPHLKFIDLIFTGADPFALTLVGSKADTSLPFGYSADVSVMAVPEPETYAMLLGGLGLVGAIARRRARKAV